MKIKITAFGYLAEKIGKDRFETEEAKDVFSLREKMEKEYPVLKELEYKIAVNQELVHGNAVIEEGSEIVLLPPFAGG